MTIEQHLDEAISWAEERLRSGAEPPFIYYRLMQLREAATELKSHAMQLAEGSPLSAEHQESVLQQAAEEHHPNIVPLHLSATRQRERR